MSCFLLVSFKVSLMLLKASKGFMFPQCETKLWEVSIINIVNYGYYYLTDIRSTIAKSQSMSLFNNSILIWFQLDLHFSFISARELEKISSYESARAIRRIFIKYPCQGKSIWLYKSLNQSNYFVLYKMNV